MPNVETDTLTVGDAWGGRLTDESLLQTVIPADDRQFIAAWRDSYFIQGSIITLVMILALSIRKIVAITPYLIGAFVRVKEIFNLENIVKLGIIRNELAAISVLSLSLLMARFRVLDFLPGKYGPVLILVSTIGIITLIWGYRYVCSRIICGLAGREKPYVVLRRGSYTYFILGCALAYIVAGILYACGIHLIETYRIAISTSVAFVWAAYMIREIQIFYQHSCSVYFSFLYLCTLEFLPIGVITLLTVIL